MSEKIDPTVILPLIPSKPRLRFLDDAPDGAAGSETSTADAADADETNTDEPDEAEGAESLGDPGKKALDAMKAKMRAAQKTARDTAAELADMKAKQETAAKPADEQAIDAARREGRSEATTTANKKLVKVGLRSAGKGKLANPSDALVFIDTAQFDVDDDGEIDTDALDEAIDKLLADRPYLAAAAAQRFSGSGDQGTRGKAKQPSQLSRDDLKTMNAQEILKADKEGRLNSIKGIK